MLDSFPKSTACDPPGVLGREAIAEPFQIGRAVENINAPCPKEIVVFGEDWGAHPSSTQHLMAHLSRSWNVLWVDSLGLRAPRLNKRDCRRLATKVRARFSPKRANPSHDKPPFPVVAPLILPFPASPLAMRLNGRLLQKRLTPLLDAAKMTRPILWASLPTAIAAVNQLGERAIVYYCGDDFSALEGVDHRSVTKLEAQIASRADLIIAASVSLASRFHPNKTIYIPHGVNAGLFSTPSQRAPDLPMGRPIAGYYGSIADWVDLDAVAAAACELPNWDFVFIGQVKTDLRPVAKLSNIRFLGPRPHSVLPSYSQHWTVSLIPFRNTPQIRACNPLKLREYLAAGRPIASSIDFPALAPYRAHLSVASSREHLSAAILEASRNDDGASRRQASVEQESWAARAAQITQALELL